MAQHEFKLSADDALWKMVGRAPADRAHDARQFIEFPTPRNLNYFWTFGGILMVCLMIQIVSGIVLAMHFVPSAADAFNSVQHIKRDVNWGWLIQSDARGRRVDVLPRRLYPYFPRHSTTALTRRRAKYCGSSAC